MTLQYMPDYRAHQSHAYFVKGKHIFHKQASHVNTVAFGGLTDTNFQSDRYMNIIT